MNVHCPDGEQYVIVEPPPPFVAGLHFGTSRVQITDAAALCRAITREN